MRSRGRAHLLHRGPSAFAGVGAFALLLALGRLDFVRLGLLLVIMIPTHPSIPPIWAVTNHPGRPDGPFVGPTGV